MLWSVGLAHPSAWSPGNLHPQWSVLRSADPMVDPLLWTGWQHPSGWKGQLLLREVEWTACYHNLYIIGCDGLNCAPPPQFIVEVLISSTLECVFGNRVFKEVIRLNGFLGKVLTQDDSVFIRRKATWRHREKRTAYKPRRETTWEINSAWHLDPGLPVSRLWENNFLLPKSSPICGSPRKLIQIPTLWPRAYIENIKEKGIWERQRLDPQEQLLEKKVSSYMNTPLLCLAFWRTRSLWLLCIEDGWWRLGARVEQRDRGGSAPQAGEESSLTWSKRRKRGEQIWNQF